MTGCHPDCGPIIERDLPDGGHAHENVDGVCVHEDEDEDDDLT